MNAEPEAIAEQDKSRSAPIRTLLWGDARFDIEGAPGADAERMAEPAQTKRNARHYMDAR